MAPPGGSREIHQTAEQPKVNAGDNAVRERFGQQAGRLLSSAEGQQIHSVVSRDQAQVGQGIVDRGFGSPTFVSRESPATAFQRTAFTRNSMPLGSGRDNEFTSNNPASSGRALQDHTQLLSGRGPESGRGVVQRNLHPETGSQISDHGPRFSAKVDRGGLGRRPDGQVASRQRGEGADRPGSGGKPEHPAVRPTEVTRSGLQRTKTDDDSVKVTQQGPKTGQDKPVVPPVKQQVGEDRARGNIGRPKADQETRGQAGSSKPEVRAESRREVQRPEQPKDQARREDRPKIEHKVEPQVEHKPEHKVEPQVEHKPEHKVEHQVEHKPEHKVEHQVEHKPEHKVEHQVEHKPEHKVEHQVEHKPEHKVEHQVEHKPEHQGEHKPEHKVEHQSEHKPEHKVEHQSEHKPENQVEHQVEHQREQKVPHKDEPKSEHNASDQVEHNSGKGLEHKTESKGGDGHEGLTVRSNTDTQSAVLERTVNKKDGTAVTAKHEGDDPLRDESSKLHAHLDNQHDHSAIVHEQVAGTTSRDIVAVSTVADKTSPSSDGHLARTSLEVSADQTVTISNVLSDRNNGSASRDLILEHSDKQNILNSQGASAGRSADLSQPVVNLPILSTLNQPEAIKSVAPGVENNISPSVQQLINPISQRLPETMRGGSAAEELITPNTNSGQAPANLILTSTATGQSNQGHSGAANPCITAHGATQSGQGQDPSATGHGNTPAGQGHQHPGKNQDPSSTAIAGTVNDPSGNNGGQCTDPSNNPIGQGPVPAGTGSGNTPTGQDPSAQAHDPNTVSSISPVLGPLNDPLNTQTGHCANDPQGQINGSVGQTNDPPGNCGNHPVDPHIHSGCPVPPVGGRGNHGGISTGEHDIVLPDYEERPIRNLVNLITEMGASLGHLPTTWSPWDASEPFQVHSISSGIHSTSHNDSSGNHHVVVDEALYTDPTISIVNSVSIISEQPQVIINTQVTGEVTPSNDVSVMTNVPYYNQLPIIEAVTVSTTAPIDEGSAALSPFGGTGSAVNNGIQIIEPNQAAEPGITNGVNHVPAANSVVQDAGSTPSSFINQDGAISTNQFLNGSVDYWAPDPNSSGPSNIQQAIPSPAETDPVPANNTINTIQADDALPNHDQLVSAAEHNHGYDENFDGMDLQNNKPRVEFSDPWSTEEAQKQHHLQEEKDAGQERELQHRLELLANNMWQEPNENKNGNNSQRESKEPKKAGSNTTAKNEGLIGQLITLINDTNKNKKTNQTYVVKKGDTLESIAAKVLLDPRLGILLYLVNTALLPKSTGIEWQHTKLPEGLILDLPSTEEIASFRLALPRGTAQNRVASVSGEASNSQWQFDQQYLQGVEQRRRNVERLLGPLASADSAKYDPETGRQRIVVRFGDTLRSIALKHSTLNDVSLWKVLAQCNNLSTEVDAKGAPLAMLTRGMFLQIPSEQEIINYRNSQAVQVRADSPRKAIAAEVLKVS